MDSECVWSMLPSVYILYEEAPPSNIKGTKITVTFKDSSRKLVQLLV